MNYGGRAPYAVIFGSIWTWVFRFTFRPILFIYFYLYLPGTRIQVLQIWSLHVR